VLSDEYRQLVQIRDRWRQMIGAYRVMVANRFGAFSATPGSLDKQADDVELFYGQIDTDLVRLAVMRDNGGVSFQTASVVTEMQAQAWRWYTYFHKVRAMYAGESWRSDLPFLRDSVQPLFDAVWQSLLALESTVEDASNTQVSNLSKAGSRMGLALWALAGALFLLLIIGYAALDRTLLTPIARISRALSFDVDVKSGHTTDIPMTGTREIRQLVAAFEKMRSNVQQRRLALEYQSLHDSLTGLPNRACLLEELRGTLGTAGETRRQTGLMIMDLDHFKEINDTLGHPVGDLILQEVAKRLAEVVDNTGHVARLGGDEFAVILPSADHRRCADMASAITAALEREFQVGGHKLYVGGSVGVALYPDHGAEVSVLMRHADVAMYMAKHTGVKTAFYDDSRDQNSLVRLQLVKELKDAIAHNRLALHYQPKLDLESDTVVCVEALLRWDHPEHGMVPPDRIIPMAEQTGLIQKLTQWVLHNALAQLVSWRCAGIDVAVAVNLSAYDLQDASLPDTVSSLLASTGVSADRLTLEITESAMMSDLTRATTLLSQIKQAGVGLAIDDFGTGFSSLSYLKKLPVRELKIDKSFVINMNRDENDAMIVHSTIDLAHNLGLSVVAEGVENREILEQLRTQGCDLIQGYYLCKPLPPDLLRQWLSERQPVDILPPHDLSASA
jgi:diguanylate cyclase (GGDEF)-like protein